MDLLKGQELLKIDGSKVYADFALGGKKLICFYFTDMMWPPNRKLTFKLKEWYEEVKEHTGAKAQFLSRNSLDFGSSKMWIL